MATDQQLPGIYSPTIMRGDPFSKTFTFTQGDEALELPTSGWRAQIRKPKAGEVIAEITVDATQADEGIVVLTWPDLAVDRYFYDLECEGVRTFLEGVITVKQDVSHDDD